ncbi:MAG: UPF0280 family protein [Verrucomicrobiota bacterium]
MRLLPFTHREANLRISSAAHPLVCRQVVRLRSELDAFLAQHPEFASAMTPLDMPAAAPPAAVAAMARAARKVGDVGPMAAVAGTMAQFAAEAAIRADIEPVLVDNGGDLCVYSREPVSVGLFAGDRSPLRDQLALRIPGNSESLCLCSSSSRMGHSLSFGDCDLALVLSADGALADAAATSAANQVRSSEDIDPTLARIAAIDGIRGILLARDDKVGIRGRAMPELTRNRDPLLRLRITKAAQNRELDAAQPTPAPQEHPQNRNRN